MKSSPNFTYFRNPKGVVPYVRYDLDVMEPGVKYPLVIFLHGAGEVGDGSEAQYKRLKNSGNHANLLSWGDQKKFLVLAPQFNINANYTYVNGVPQNNWQPDWKGGQYVMDVINWAKENMPIDPARIYLTGLSSGGGGCLDFPTQKQEFADSIAALLPICPADQQVVSYDYPVKSNLPVWLHHANNDPSNGVTASINFARALNGRGIQPAAKTTIYPTGGHGIWGNVYGDVRNIDWMLAQKNGEAIPNEPEEPQEPEPPAKTVVAKLEITVYSDGTSETKKLQ